MMKLSKVKAAILLLFLSTVVVGAEGAGKVINKIDESNLHGRESKNIFEDDVDRNLQGNDGHKNIHTTTSSSSENDNHKDQAHHRTVITSDTLTNLTNPFKFSDRMTIGGPSETETPSKVPSSDLCDVANVMGQTIFVPGPPNTCWRIQLAKGGTLEGDFGDSLCTKDESDWESTSGIFSRF